MSAAKKKAAPKKSAVGVSKSKVGVKKSAVAPKKSAVAPKKSSVAPKKSAVASKKSAAAPKKSSVAASTLRVAKEPAAPAKPAKVDREGVVAEGEGFEVPRGLEREINKLIKNYPQRRSASLMVLHALQSHFGWISKDAIEWTAGKLELQPINVYELVTFYPMFNDKPVGRYHLKVCRTLSCALGGSHELHGHLCGKLGLDAKGHGPQTTSDGKYTVEFAECLASCGTAPVMMCNDDFYENVSHADADEVLENCE